MGTHCSSTGSGVRSSEESTGGEREKGGREREGKGGGFCCRELRQMSSAGTTYSAGLKED